jgi:hypothetical protein
LKKIDHKKSKIDNLKRTKNEFEQKLNRQKSTIDNIKVFLRVLNSNFQKSMKSIRLQNSNIKEQYL